MSWESIQVGAYELADGGLVVHQNPSLEDAEGVGRLLAEWDRRNQRWLGQWYLDIRERWPDTYSQVLDPDTHDEGTLAEYARVVKRVQDWQPSVPFTAHQAVSGLDRGTQRRILQKAASERMTVAQVRGEVRREAARTIARSSVSGSYRVVYVNPVYSRGTVNELAAVDMGGLLGSSAAVFLWVTETYRDQVVGLYEKWGVRRVATIVWDMQTVLGPTAYMKTRHQYLLWLVRGKCPPEAWVDDSVVSVRPNDDGSRPERFREIIDRAYPGGDKLELYARHDVAIDGWTFMGKPGAGVAGEDTGRKKAKAATA